jgi:hypothetical protein
MTTQTESIENGIILWSDWNVVAIATTGSSNAKTGPMIQIWLIDRNLHPVESIRTGKDASLQCSGCPFASGSGCYVSPLPLMAIWRKFQRNEYPTLSFFSPEWEAFWKGKAVRFGAYGNPSLLPLPVVESIAKLAMRHTGYFHNWRELSPEEAKAYGRFFMASCEPWNVQKAYNLGLRTFTVIPEGEQLPEGYGIECLADSKGLTCTECGLCDGTQRSERRTKALPSIWIEAHGFKTKKANSVLNN